MKTNVVILNTNETKTGLVIARHLATLVVEDEHYWDHKLEYFQSVSGETWVSLDGALAQKCNPDLVIDPEKESRHGGQHYRKMNRSHRISLMTEYLWAPDYLFGKNRRLRRRMWPSPENIRESEEYLPF